MRRALRIDARTCRSRATKKLKMGDWWLCVVSCCCWDVVELDLSFHMSIRSPSNSFGVLRTSTGSVFGQFGFGAESARCVLVEFSVHFEASEWTFGAPLADLEAKNMRLIIV